MSIQQEKFKAIADKIRDKTGETDLIKPNDFVNKIDDVYDAGKKDILGELTSLYGFFMSNRNWGLYDYLFKQNLDISRINIMQYTFQDNTNITEFTAPESMNATSVHGLFKGCSNLTKVSGLEKGISSGSVVLSDLFADCTNLRDAGTLNFENVQYAKNTFFDCSKLEEVRITGTITCEYTTGGLYLGACTLLSRESIESIVNHLSDTIGMTLTLSTTAVNSAFETSEGANDGSTSDEWLALTGTKTNWTITLS